jgi:hypothetical protein
LEGSEWTIRLADRARDAAVIATGGISGIDCRRKNNRPDAFHPSTDEELDRARNVRLVFGPQRMPDKSEGKA